VDHGHGDHQNPQNQERHRPVDCSLVYLRGIRRPWEAWGGSLSEFPAMSREFDCNCDRLRREARSVVVRARGPAPPRNARRRRWMPRTHSKSLYVRHHRKPQGHPRHDRRLPHRDTRDREWTSTSKKRTSSNAPPTSAGSPDAPTSSTDRPRTAQPALISEGALDTPARDRFWDLVRRHGVTILYTVPTAIRAFIKWGAEAAKA
jgi:hypothetical protein